MSTVITRRALTHLSLHVQLAADSVRPSASTSEEFWKAATYTLKHALYDSSSCVETVSSGASQAVSTQAS